MLKLQDNKFSKLLNLVTLRNFKQEMLLFNFIGYRETAFTHAITAAGILHQVATSCALGKISSCR